MNVSTNSYRIAARVRHLQAVAKANPLARAGRLEALEQVSPDIVLGLSVNA